MPDKVTELEYLTVEEVAKLLRVSAVTATRRFQNETGVLNLGLEGGNRRLRIPRHVLNRFIAERSQPLPRFEPKVSWRVPRRLAPHLPPLPSAS